MSKVTTFVDIMTWLLVVTEYLSPSTSAAFPVPELCPFPSPHPQPQRKSALSVPAWTSLPRWWGGEQPWAQRKEGRRCLCLPLVRVKSVSQAVRLTRHTLSFGAKGSESSRMGLHVSVFAGDKGKIDEKTPVPRCILAKGIFYDIVQIEGFPLFLGVK